MPAEPNNEAVFPVGSKFTIKLHPVDSVNFEYSIKEFEHIDTLIDLYDNDDLFDSLGVENTIAFYFCFATRGETEQERKANMNIVLFMKNYTSYPLNYTSEIQRKEKRKKFEATSNMGTFPGAKGMEMWPYMIYHIKLKDFKRMNI
jgi:hypothetical protein